MADMPILSGLVGQTQAPAAATQEGAAPAGITFDDLTPEQFAALQQEAAQAAMGVSADEAPAAEGDSEQPGDSDLEQAEAMGAVDPAEAEEPTEEELAEQEAAEAAQVAQLAEALSEEITSYREQAEALIDIASESEDGDPKKVKKAAKDLVGVEKDVAKALKKVQDAAAEGDLEDAQKAYEEVEQLGQDALELFQEAQDAAAAPAGGLPQPGDESASTGKPAPATAAPAKAPAGAPKSPLAIWAGR